MLSSTGTLAALLAAAFLAAPAAAQFTSAPPFAGTSWERFDEPSSQPCVSTRVFQDQGDLCSMNGSSTLWVALSFGGLGCTLWPHSPPRMANCPGSSVVLTFDAWATKFGGFFTSNRSSSLGEATIRFYDPGGVQVYAETFAVPVDCDWTWHGWDTGGVHVKSIEITSADPSGGYVGLDDLQANIGPPETGNAFCFCDQSDTCPVPGYYGAGCANSQAPLGGRLYATGTPSVSASSVVLRADYLTYYGPGVFFQGDQSVNGGAGTPFGPGLLCVTQNTLRLETTLWPGVTSTHSTVDLPTVSGNQILAGQTKTYQLWYRENVYGPCSGGWNLTNALRITWAP